MVQRRVRVRVHSSPNNVDNRSSFDANGDGGGGGGNRRNRRRTSRLPDKDLYEVLGADPTTSRAEIKWLYIALVKETHLNSVSSPGTPPSHGGGIVVGTGEAASADRFNEITRACVHDFKEEVVRRAGEVAREYGLTSRRFYNDAAVPFLTERN